MKKLKTVKQIRKHLEEVQKVLIPACDIEDPVLRQCHISKLIFVENLLEAIK